MDSDANGCRMRMMMLNTKTMFLWKEDSFSLKIKKKKYKVNAIKAITDHDKSLKNTLKKSNK